ncbi:thaumatin [Russula earlei]|uniref:Thaumatin n=1 Tax=Russula earlei TaxID=71964 RepID=A0ACC0UEA8_9AGAM|nr:thaumatin [Russula earlei]
MKLSFAFILFTIALPTGATGRTITVYNACPFTICSGKPVPSQVTGWEAPAYSHVAFDVADDWTSGRIWGRRDCDFSSNPGANSCLDGGCDGGLVCDHVTGTGVPPATLAEFTLSGFANGFDYYDVSLVDGYNLPMKITNTAGCSVASCPVDLGPNCWDYMTSSGFPVGCKSACVAHLPGDDPNNSPNCCTGSHSSAATCPSSGVAYYSYFKSNCPDSYAYAYDESSKTALWTCPSSANADYTVTFCP